MTTNIPRTLIAVAVGSLALGASAHEVDCSKLAAIAIQDPNGTGPLLDPAGLPSLAAAPAPVLTVNSYPALVAFDVRIRNLAAAPSVLTAVSDTMSADRGPPLVLRRPARGDHPGRRHAPPLLGRQGDVPGGLPRAARRGRHPSRAGCARVRAQPG